MRPSRGLALLPSPTPVTLLDARRIEATELRTDVCVVGAGAAGITLARELSAAGREVLLLESGPLHADQDAQGLADLENTGYPVREAFMSRARYFGGSCNLWAGRSMRLAPEDIEERAWVPGSGWPIGWQELAPYYERAARLLELPALERFDPATWEPSLTADERLLFDEPLAPTVSLWARSPKRFGRDHRRELQRSARVRVLLCASAMGLETDSDGSRVAALAAGTLEGRRLRIAARQYVLACGGMENARLLLLSRDEHHPAGLGNAGDRVGRFFMDHPRAVFGSVVLERPGRFPLLRSRPLVDGKVQFGLRLSPELQRREGLLNHYVTFEKKVSGYAEAGYQSFVQTMKVVLRRGYAGRRRDLFKARFGHIPGMVYLLTPKELLPHAVWRHGTRLRERLRRPPEREERIVVYFCEQPPDPESRVTLSDQRDALGLPRTVLRWRLGDEVHASVHRLQEVLGAELARRGAGTLVPGEGEPRYTDASHHMGTTRMSLSERDGVVDTDGRVHGTSNLYVAGSSTFPSAGHQNPTLTLLALTLRLACHLERG